MVIRDAGGMSLVWRTGQQQELLQVDPAVACVARYGKHTPALSAGLNSWKRRVNRSAIGPSNSRAAGTSVGSVYAREKRKLGPDRSSPTLNIWVIIVGG